MSAQPPWIIAQLLYNSRPEALVIEMHTESLEMSIKPPLHSGIRHEYVRAFLAALTTCSDVWNWACAIGRLATSSYSVSVPTELKWKWKHFTPWQRPWQPSSAAAAQEWKSLTCTPKRELSLDGSVTFRTDLQRLEQIWPLSRKNAKTSSIETHATWRCNALLSFQNMRWVLVAAVERATPTECDLFCDFLMDSVVKWTLLHFVWATYLRVPLLNLVILHRWKYHAISVLKVRQWNFNISQ